MNQTLKLLLAASLLTVSLFSAEGKKKAEKESPAPVHKNEPTVKDAHELIEELIDKHALSRVWHGSGKNCSSAYSIIKNTDDYKDIFGVEWADVSKVYREDSSPNNVVINGIFSVNPGGENRTVGKITFIAIDERTASQLQKAMTLLMNSCKKKSKFD
jgi:hypothetical protein